jgi:hypothetical protein
MTSQLVFGGRLAWVDAIKIASLHRQGQSRGAVRTSLDRTCRSLGDGAMTMVQSSEYTANTAFGTGPVLGLSTIAGSMRPNLLVAVISCTFAPTGAIPSRAQP